jgi:hypothetical protein
VTSDTSTAGYSGKPLAVKLGIKAGQRVAVLNAPADYFSVTLGAVPAEVSFSDALTGEAFDLIHFFTRQAAELRDHFPALKAHLKRAGGLWISWPKGASKVPTDLNETLIREIGLDGGLVDVKVAAVDSVWSGLKFVYRLRDRA